MNGRRMGSYGTAAIVGAGAIWVLRRRHDRILQDRCREHWADHSPDEPIHSRKRPCTNRRTGGDDRRSWSAVWGYTAAIWLYLGILLAGEWWNPTTWWSSVQGDAAKVFDDLKQVVKSGVDWAIRTVEAVVDAGFAVIDGAISDVSNALGAVWSWTESEVLGAYDWINHTFGDIIEDVYNTVRGWVNDAINWGNDVLQWAENAAASLVKDIDDAYNWVVSNVWDPLVGWIDNAANWWGQLFDSAWQWVDDNVIHPILAAINDAWQYIDTLWDWWVNVARDALDLFLRAESWIELFAEYPTQTLEGIIHDALSTFSVSKIVTLGNEADSYVDSILDDFAGML